MDMELDPIPDEDYLEKNRDAASGMLQIKIKAFNTNVALSCFVDESQSGAVEEQFVSACRRYERLFSRSLPNSDISRINKSGGQPVAVDIETANILEFSKLYCNASDGYFDVTVAPLLDLWAKGQRDDAEPTEGKLKRMTENVDWHCIQILREGKPVLGPSDKQRGWLVQLSNPRTCIDLGGIAKGFIADRLGTLLRRLNVQSFLVDVGGDILVGATKPDGSKWRVAINGVNGEAAGFVEVANRAVVTSGTSQRHYTIQGTDYPHIIDPRTGRPTDSTLASVTLVTERALDAEGYSTTVLLLDNDAVDFIKSTKVIKTALLIDTNGEVFTV